jgi:hypothetical protein
MPSRRAVLAILTAAFAGCTTPSTDTNRTTDPATEPTARRSGASEEIDTARARLRAAADIYVTDAGPDATLRDVTAASPDSFPWQAVVDECRAADDTIRAGRQVTRDDQRQTLDELAAASQFLQASARLQRDLIRAENALRGLRDAVYEGASRADDRRATVERTLEESNPQMETVTASDPAVVAGALDAFDADLVRGKRAQFRGEDRQMWDLSSALTSVTSGLSAITAGWSAWTDGGYERAGYEFGTAVEDLAAARSHLDEGWATSLRAFGTSVTGAVAALHTGSTHLQRATAEMLDGSANAATEHVAQARAAFRERDVVATEVRAVRPILAE